MSKSAMLRTRRRDVNVKPNRRLDRKSSRGMIYENEELRLRTININAEIERGQSDIKKLRRENEQLRKEIWCLRDEYEKLDKLLKEKAENTSCSSCTSDTDSCTSCSESEENETSQNIENVQKTTLNNLRTEFDHLSVVTEETSAENSDKNSNSATSPKECTWAAIPPDQSYPNSQTLPLPTSKSALPMEQMPKHFFAPLKSSKSYENCNENNLCVSSWSLGGNSYANTPANWMQFVNFDQNFNKEPPIVMQKPALPACHQVVAQKTILPPPPGSIYEPNLPPPPSFEPNLTTLPIGTKITNCPTSRDFPCTSDLSLCKKTAPDILVKTDLPNFSQESSTNSFVNGGNLDELLHDIQTISNDILQISTQQDNQKLTNTFVPNLALEAFEPVIESSEETLDDPETNPNERPYKSELNVVLMPKAMPLLGFEKYQNIKSSLESIATLQKSAESLHMLDIPAPEVNIPNLPPPSQNFTPQPFPAELLSFTPPNPATPILPHRPDLSRQPSNPFFYGTFDSYQNTDALANRFKPDMFAHDNFPFKNEVLQQSSNKPEEKDDKTNIKTNIENEIVENKAGNKQEKEAKQEKSENEKNDSKKDLNKKEDVQQKSPKSRRTRKVSIYFKGKKDKLARSLSLDTKMMHQDTPKPAEKSPIIDERKSNLPKTSSSESKMSLFDGICKNQDASEKILNSDTNKTSSDSKNSNYDRKHRKSSSTSPERKHVHVKLEGEKKCHKKRHKKSERRLPANRRMSVDRLRERSFSVCTDRSNILDHKFGHFEDYTNSERDRSNSLSSCDTVKSRKMSQVPQFQVTGKIPWFGCWGNGCL